MEGRGEGARRARSGGGVRRAVGGIERVAQVNLKKLKRHIFICSANLFLYSACEIFIRSKFSYDRVFVRALSDNAFVRSRILSFDTFELTFNFNQSIYIFISL